MSNKSEKRYRKIKRTSIWSSILEFVLFSVAAAVMLAVAIQIFASYIIDSKMISEYERIEYMARLYDNGLKNKDENIYNLLVEEGHDYMIVSDDGKLLHINGENTISDQSGTVRLSEYGEDVLVYRDKERGFVYPGSNGRLGLDFMAFREWIASEDDAYDNDTADSDIEKAYEIHTKMIQLPIWISVDVDGGSKHFIGKAVFSVNRHDTRILTYLTIAMAALLVIILITMLAAAIKNVVRQKRMINLFFTDIVTDGHNWSWFLIKGDKMLRKRSSAKHKFALISLSFVNYRNYCVCHSVAEGEALLCRINDLIEKNTKKNEICAHTTSASFALMLRYSDKAELERRIKKLIESLSLMDEDHRFNFQAGVALIGEDAGEDGKRIHNRDVDLDTEYNNASAAKATLSASDDSGIAFFDTKLIEEQQWLDKVQEKQQSALDNEEFVVYYQPKYDPRDTKLMGAEALIRWDSPDFGFVPPGKFIPIFEKNGFITKIDHYMLKHVAADQKAWLDAGYNCVPVSVNVSRAHFIESDLAEQIRDIVDEAGTPHEYIEIELTESAFFDDKKALLNTIGRLKDYGFAVSMDDFGSGYSSLNSLKDMPLDVLKLDAEFFRGDTTDGRGEIVVSEAIKLGKQLNMRIVAEGVEVKEQVDFLAKEGCDMIQGYYFAKPMAGDDFVKKMQGVIEKPESV
ncbi:MAG: GGDEF domain-containing protein [Lachnospiraceae bacterium]|nr:GGDEF domain-containing protein [Lachnospiraceae bacterium]